MNVKQFLAYQHNYKLGYIYLQTRTYGLKNRVDLSRLMSLINVNITDPDDIRAVIIFGSATHWPGYTVEEYYSKKYYLFGVDVKRHKKIPVEVRDNDFMVITKREYFEVSRAKPKCVTGWSGSCDTSVLDSSGIDLINRSVKQIERGIDEGWDTIALSAIRDGVILADDGTGFLDFINTDRQVDKYFNASTENDILNFYLRSRSSGPQPLDYLDELEEQEDRRY